MPFKPCPDCQAPLILGNKGNGKCANCYGSGRTGTIITEMTDGNPACRKCRGTGSCQTCGGHGEVPAEQVKRPNANVEINPFDKEAIQLSCPKCGDIDWFEWRFLGKLTDPVCGYQWYVDSGVYAGKQIRASFQLGKKIVKYFNHGVSGEGAWIAKAAGAFTGMVIGLVVRLPYGVLMIPVQAVARAVHLRNASATSDKKDSVAAG